MTNEELCDALEWGCLTADYSDSGIIARIQRVIEPIEAERDANRDLLEAQVGTITALNIALGGKDSTSTENLVDSHEPPAH